MFERLQDHLVIVGCGKYGEAIPYDDENYEKWVIGYQLHHELQQKLNDIGDYNIDIHSDYLKEFFPNTRGFEIHTMGTRQDWYLDWLHNTNFEIIMQDEFKDIKHSLKYPLDDILIDYNSRYFLCSFSYMIALAMKMKYTQIHFYGVNMLFNDDYIQKYNMEYWLGRAEQLGLKLFFTENCDLLKCGALYGYEAVNTLGVYQYRYMKELEKVVDDRLEGIELDAQNMLFKVISAKRYLTALKEEQPKFLQEILDRHKIEGKIEIQENWDGEDV